MAKFRACELHRQSAGSDEGRWIGPQGGRYKVVEALAAKEAFYFAYGDNDAFVIRDFPDAASGLAMVMAVNGRGPDVHDRPADYAGRTDAASKKTVNPRARAQLAPFAMLLEPRAPLRASG
jgi:hypothetical protein